MMRMKMIGVNRCLEMLLFSIYKIQDSTYHDTVGWVAGT